MEICRHTICGQCYSYFIRIQIGYTAYFFGKNWLPTNWQGLQVGLFAPAHNPNVGYRLIAFYLSLLPAMPGPVSEWPKVYRWMNHQMRSRRVLLNGFI